MPSPASDSPSPLAQAIADGVEPDWETDSDGAGRDAAMRLLRDVAAGFRRSEAAETSPAPTSLFSWRHLEITEEIGSGAFGQVFRARDPVLRRDVALKLARQDSVHGADARSVIAEARSMARLRHPQILAVHGADDDNGRVGIWCDLLEGRTLAAVLDDVTRLPAAETLAMVRPLAGALELIHDRGLSHGDIKPANIMVQPDGSPVLMDFGAARGDLGLTPAYGSPMYMAPERFVDHAAPSPAADCYAFGVVLYRMLSGRHPVEADSLADLQAAHAGGQAPDLAVLPLRFRGLVGALLARDPAARPTARALGRHLERIAGSRSRWLRRGAVTVVIVSLAVAALAATLAYRSAIEARDRTERVKDVMAEAVESALPTRQSGPTSVVAMFEKLAELIEERLDDYPAALAEMRVVTGAGLVKLGETEKGLEIAEAGAALLADVRADEPRDLVASWLEMATLRTLVDDNAGAEEAIRNALAALPAYEEKNPEAAAASRLIAMNRLALLLGQQGRWTEELEVAKELLELRRAHYGDGSIRLAVDYHNLAGAQRVLGDLEPALVNEREAEALLRAAGDEDSVRMGFVLSGLASILIDAGRLDEAGDALARVREIYEANLPPGHRNLEFLDQTECQLLVARGDTAAARLRVERLAVLEGDDFTATRHSARELLARIAAAEQRWSDAHEHFRTLRDGAPERYLPLRPWFEAAVAFSGWRAGLGADARPSIETAMALLEANGLERTRQYADLERWRTQIGGSP